MKEYLSARRAYFIVISRLSPRGPFFRRLSLATSLRILLNISSQASVAHMPALVLSAVSYHTEKDETVSPRLLELRILAPWHFLASSAASLGYEAKT
jgi:hypothetical protein